MDVTPRHAAEATGARPARRRRLQVWIALAVVLAALGWILVQGLGSATVYFKTAAEAVRDKESLGTKRIRVEGVVQDDVEQVGDGVHFTITDGETVEVRHLGDPPQLFKPGIPVVLEGHWDASGDWFDSDRIMVKHSSEYKAKHPDRVTTTSVEP